MATGEMTSGSATTRSTARPGFARSAARDCSDVSGAAASDNGARIVPISAADRITPLPNRLKERAGPLPKQPFAPFIAATSLEFLFRKRADTVVPRLRGARLPAERTACAGFSSPYRREGFR